MAGTYYPPTDRAGQISFDRLLLTLNDAWHHQRERIEEQASELAGATGREVSLVDHLAPFNDAIDLVAVRRHLRDELLIQADDDGGFGSAPKFPRPSYVDALLDFDDPDARAAVTTTLDAMARRGLYDHFGGGFARYSVDGEWHVPHFEKMLSDQALLARCYARASVVMNRPEWREVTLDTLGFVARDLRRVDGYASSLDADAGGVEGSHVTWTQEEILELLGPENTKTTRAVTARWRIESPGAFEGRSIPRLADGEPFTTPASLDGAHERMMERRRARIQPGRDEKIVLEWNAMIASAFLRSDDQDFVNLGLELLHSLRLTHFADDAWWRTERHQAHAGASDVAWLADAFVDAFERTGDDQWLRSAHDVVAYLLAHYWDGPRPTSASPHEGGGVFSQSDLVRDLATRPKEIFDGATPSSHATATRALARVGLCLGDNELLVVAQRLVELAGSLLVNHPATVSDLVDAAGFALNGVEVVVPGSQGAMAHHVRSMAMARTVLITGSGSTPLLAQRLEGQAYVCRGGVCLQPATTVDELDTQLRTALTAWPS
jgi:uncharacterized protein YyaL (SSP411 family)